MRNINISLLFWFAEIKKRPDGSMPMNRGVLPPDGVQPLSTGTVSYTHLDVYKRQPLAFVVKAGQNARHFRADHNCPDD